MKNEDYKLYEIYVKENKGDTKEDIEAKLEFARTQQLIANAMLPSDEYLTIPN